MSAKGALQHQPGSVLMAVWLVVSFAPCSTCCMYSQEHSRIAAVLWRTRWPVLSMVCSTLLQQYLLSKGCVRAEMGMVKHC